MAIRHRPIITPGPIEMVDPDFLYQLDIGPGKGINLWCAIVRPNNGYDPKFAHAATKLFAAAPALLRATHALLENFKAQHGLLLELGNPQFTALRDQAEEAIRQTTLTL